MPQMVSVSYDILDRQHAPLRSTDDDKAKKEGILKTDEGLDAQTWRTVDGWFLIRPDGRQVDTKTSMQEYHNAC